MAARVSSGVVTMMLPRRERPPGESVSVRLPPTAQPGGQDARASDLAERGAVALRETPGAVLEDLDGDAGGDAEMQVELAVEVLEMAVAVDEARQHDLARARR